MKHSGLYIKKSLWNIRIYISVLYFFDEPLQLVANGKKLEWNVVSRRYLLARCLPSAVSRAMSKKPSVDAGARAMANVMSSF